MLDVVKYLRNRDFAILIVKWFLVIFPGKKNYVVVFQEIHVVSIEPPFLLAMCPLFSCKMNNDFLKANSVLVVKCSDS